ncbi:MAG TPA: SpoIIE family protein phosphatase [Acidobacteriaceae bacterium]|nr:SpoIIE family protein phosphatase [Acidobacteriaceae bacterium]
MARSALVRLRSRLGGTLRSPSRLTPLLLLLAAATLVPAPALGQALTVQNPGTGTVPLDGKWQFHLGDNLAWAEPSYDDSGWEQMTADAPWGAQTHPSYAGYAWYRRHIAIDNSGPAATKHLAVLIPPVEDAYDLYWNGKKIGSYGGFPPHAIWWITGHGAVYNLPQNTGSGVLALRVWKAPLSSVDPSEVGGFLAAPSLGDARILATNPVLRSYTNDEHRLPNLLISAVILVAGLLSLLLYFRDRDQGLYVWLALYLLGGGLVGLQTMSALRQALTFSAYQFITQLLESTQDISMWFILLSLFGMAKDRRWHRVTLWLVTAYLSAQAIDIVAIFLWAKGWPSLPWIDGVTTAVYSITPLYVFVIIGYGLTRRKHLTLWPLIIAACLSGLYNCTTNLLGQGIRFTHWTIDNTIINLGIRIGPYFFGIAFILSTLIFLALIFTIAREQFLERQRQARIELEIKSAQEVQKILVPDDTPAIPGLAIASIYRPAEEVGGDFFQVIPSSNGGALIVLGDVSGKGLKAAMTVSLIVGTLRTLADYTQSPALILAGLNRRLMGRTDGGFATCVVARITPDGLVTLANAGHLAPFRNGDELPVAGSLPLGLASDTEYDELDFRLHEGESLIFYTDGVVEARSESGELYGFDRVSALVASAGSVEEIVETACAFGQKDDITVLRLTRLAQSAPAHEARINLAAQIARA